MEILPDHVLLAHILPVVSARSLGDLCRLSEVSHRFRRLLERTLSSYRRIVRRYEPNRQAMLNSAAFEGLRDLVFYCVRMGTSDWDGGMCNAAEGGLRGAARGGHRQLVDYFISRGAMHWNGAAKIAKVAGHVNLGKYLFLYEFV